MNGLWRRRTRSPTLRRLRLPSGTTYGRSGLGRGCLRPSHAVRGPMRLRHGLGRRATGGCGCVPPPPVIGTCQCSMCQRCAQSLSIRVLTAACKGARGREGYRRIVLAPQGHRLIAVYPGTGAAAPFLTCARRGAWSIGRPVKLYRPCCGPATGGRAVLRLLARGMHLGDRSADRSLLWVRDGEVTYDSVQLT